MATQPSSSVSYDSSRRILGVTVTLMVLMPGIALAQPPRPPVVELGAQGSKQMNDFAPVAWALRLTVPVKPRTAIEVTADIQRSFGDLSLGQWRTSAKGFSAHWRQTLFTSGRVQIFGLLGGGRNREETIVPQRISAGGRVEPGYRFVDSEFVGHLGSAVQVELAPWLALRGDLRGFIGGGKRGVRVLVGAAPPTRRGRAVDQPGAPAPAAPTPSAKPNTPGFAPPPSAGWQRLKPGREVWVTTSRGSLVHGDVAAISDSSLTIRQQDREVTIRLDDVRLVEGRDGLKNGFLSGLVIGAVPSAVAGGLVGSSWASNCGSDCGDSTEAEVTRNGILIGAVGGAVVGSFIGMMVDALIPGRQTLVVRDAIRVKAVMTPTTKGLDLTIGWR